MTLPPFERVRAWTARGIEHGFGTRTSNPETLAPLSLVRQVHGERIVEAPDPRAAAPAPQADALFTRQPGRAVGIVTADCVPILLADTAGRAVAAVHAGWRGCARAIARKTVETLSAQLGIEPRSWQAAIGPHIGPCCYEVDGPVREAIDCAAVFTPAGRPDRFQLDLAALVRRQLAEAGLCPDQIAQCGGCTACDAERYWSYRRDGTGGRLLHFVRLSRGERDCFT